MLPAFGPGEGHRPSTGQRAGAGRPSIGAAAGDPVVGAVTPRGRQPARPHAATPTRAALPRSPAIFYRTQPARRRDAKRAAGSPSARLQPLFAKRLLKLLTFGRVTGGVNVTDRGLTAACTLRRMPASPREVGGAVGATIALLFTLGACEDTPRKKSFARLKPRPRDCPRTPVLRRARIPRLTAPSLVCAPQVTPTFADRLGLSEPFGVRSCCWPDSAFQCLGADVVGAVNPLHVRAIRFPPLNDVAARRAP